MFKVDGCFNFGSMNLLAEVIALKHRSLMFDLILEAIINGIPFDQQLVNEIDSKAFNMLIKEHSDLGITR